MKRLTILLSVIFAYTIKLEGQSSQLASEEELMTWIEADKEKMRAKTDELVYLVLIKIIFRKNLSKSS